MDAFEKKSIITSLKNKYSELSVLGIRDYSRNCTYEEFTLKMSSGAVNFYTGMLIESSSKSKIEHLSRKIEYANAAIMSIKNGIEDLGLLEEDIKWRTRIGYHVDSWQEDKIKKYAMALYKATGGVFEALLAIEMLEKENGEFKMDPEDFYSGLTSVLQEYLESKLIRIDFYKKHKKTKLKIKVKRKITRLTKMVGR